MTLAAAVMLASAKYATLPFFQPGVAFRETPTFIHLHRIITDSFAAAPVSMRDPQPGLHARSPIGFSTVFQTRYPPNRIHAWRFKMIMANIARDASWQCCSSHLTG